MKNKNNMDYMKTFLKWILFVGACALLVISLIEGAIFAVIVVIVTIIAILSWTPSEEEKKKTAEVKVHVMEKRLQEDKGKKKEEQQLEEAFRIIREKQKWEKKEYEDLKKYYPHGVATFEKSHPGCSFAEIIDKHTEVWHLEQDYKNEEKKRIEEEARKQREEEDKKDYDDLKKYYPNGVAAFEKANPGCSYAEIIDKRTEVWHLEQDYKNAEKKRIEEGKTMKNSNESALDSRLERSIQRISKLQEREPFVVEKLKLLKESGEAFRKMSKQWERLNGIFLYSWLFYYYPTTCDFDVKGEDDENRKTVWNFKNDPARHIRFYAHKEAIDNLLPRLWNRLKFLYGKNNLKDLTLVCIPASTQVKNKARYESFSMKLCEKTGMENGYEHIHFVKDGISKNDPNNSSGNSIRPEVVFDEWFDGKFVVLFDDVVTKGDTMLYYRQQLMKVDAIVVGGICLGQTRHTKPTTLEVLKAIIEQNELSEEEKRQTQLEIKEIINARLKQFQEEGDEECTGA